MTVFRFSLIIAILSVAFPTLSSARHFDQERVVSSISAYEAPLACSEIFFGTEINQQGSDEVKWGFSISFPKLGLQFQTVASQVSSSPSFLSLYWGRLQFLNIPPPAFLS
jgi:hypothetical protein